MDGACRVKMDVADLPEPEEAHKSQLRTVLAVLLTVMLCVAGILSITLHYTTQEQSHTGKNDDLHHTLRQISMNVRAAIHLEGKYNSELKSSVQWIKDVDQYHSEGGLILKDNEIVIPCEGLYFVYSQASFRVSCYADDGDHHHQSGPRQMVHLSHSVKRWSDSYSSGTGPGDALNYESILHSVRTACEKTPISAGDDRAQGKWFSAVYMGAVFHLNKGDRLKTVTEEKLLTDIDEGSGKTFFGVFAL